jgi:hypothetical protein
MHQPCFGHSCWLRFIFRIWYIIRWQPISRGTQPQNSTLRQFSHLEALLTPPLNDLHFCDFGPSDPPWPPTPGAGLLACYRLDTSFKKSMWRCWMVVKQSHMEFVMRFEVVELKPCWVAKCLDCGSHVTSSNWMWSFWKPRMKRFIRQSSILVIKSKTFFAFTSRRLKEAQNVLLNLAKYRPSNFGISTAILISNAYDTFHLPHTCHQEGLSLGHLRDIHFEEIMTDCGMFFLHDLDLDHHCIHSIPTPSEILNLDLTRLLLNKHDKSKISEIHPGTWLMPSHFYLIWVLNHLNLHLMHLIKCIKVISQLR